VKGVFVVGEAIPGTLIMLYPGTVHLDLRTATEAELKDNDFLLGRFDGALINARDWDLKVAAAQTQLQLLHNIKQEEPQSPAADTPPHKHNTVDSGTI
jgi:hypothetical protein